MVDRAKGNLAEMERERDGKVRPLNEQVKEINSTYREPREALETTLSILLKRLDDYRKAEEAKRRAAAEEAQRKLEEAEEAARNAAALAAERISDAACGAESEVAEASIEAQRKEHELAVASRVAARADRDTKVRIGGGYGRILSTRRTEVLVIEDCVEAIMEIGLTDKLSEAIKSEARAFRDKHGNLPSGVKSTYKEELK